MFVDYRVNLAFRQAIGYQLDRNMVTLEDADCDTAISRVDSAIDTNQANVLVWCAH